MLAGPGVAIEPSYMRIVTGEPHPFGNFAMMREEPDGKSLRNAVEPLAALNVPAAVLFVGDAPADQVDLLAKLGFHRHGGLPAMAVDIEHLATTSLPTGYSFARVHQQSDRALWGEVFARGYGLPAPVGAAFAAGIVGDARQDAPLQYFWITSNGEPVCTSIVYFDDGVAGIYGVATVPEQRRKGLAAHATAEPLRIARSLGYHVGVLQASEDGHPVYRRLGFSDHGMVPLFVRMPG